MYLYGSIQLVIFQQQVLKNLRAKIKFYWKLWLTILVFYSYIICIFSTTNSSHSCYNQHDREPAVCPTHVTIATGSLWQQLHALLSSKLTAAAAAAATDCINTWTRADTCTAWRANLVGSSSHWPAHSAKCATFSDARVRNRANEAFCKRMSIFLGVCVCALVRVVVRAFIWWALGYSAMPDNGPNTSRTYYYVGIFSFCAHKSFAK